MHVTITGRRFGQPSSSYAAAGWILGPGPTFRLIELVAHEILLARQSSWRACRGTAALAARRLFEVDFKLNLNAETVDQCHPAEPLCLAPDATVAEALRQMKERNSGAVLICDDQIVIGIFTERDALKMMAAGASFNVPLRGHMTCNPVGLRVRDIVGKAIGMMVQGGYRRLPIVDDQGRPTGIVNVEGIMHYLVEHFPAVIYNLPPEPHQSTQQREGA